jgi:hypothetical protein
MDTPCRDLADQLEATTAQAVAALRLAVPGRDWIDEILDAGGDGLTSTEAADIADTSVSTICRRAADAALIHKPIAILFAGAVWLFGLRRLLDAIEERHGLPARLVARPGCGNGSDSLAFRKQPNW